MYGSFILNFYKKKLSLLEKSIAQFGDHYEPSVEEQDWAAVIGFFEERLSGETASKLEKLVELRQELIHLTRQR